jgi:hypothetical protein
MIDVPSPWERQQASHHGWLVYLVELYKKHKSWDSLFYGPTGVLRHRRTRRGEDSPWERTQAYVYIEYRLYYYVVVSLFDLLMIQYLVRKNVCSPPLRAASIITPWNIRM